MMMWMSLKAQLLTDMKEAMKAKDTLRKNAIQMVRAAVLQIEKDQQIELNDDDIIDVIARELKKRRASLSEFEKSGRQDLIDELKREIEVLIQYLPKQLSDEELEKIVAETISEVGATSMKDMGKVMSTIGPKVKGRADNGRISAIAKRILS
jgi:uncharacterized protein YqeY